MVQQEQQLRQGKGHEGKKKMAAWGKARHDTTSRSKGMAPATRNKERGCRCLFEAQMGDQIKENMKRKHEEDYLEYIAVNQT